MLMIVMVVVVVVTVEVISTEAEVMWSDNMVNNCIDYDWHQNKKPVSESSMRWLYIGNVFNYDVGQSHLNGRNYA